MFLDKAARLAEAHADSLRSSLERRWYDRARLLGVLLDDEVYETQDVPRFLMCRIQIGKIGSRVRKRSVCGQPDEASAVICGEAAAGELGKRGVVEQPRLIWEGTRRPGQGLCEPERARCCIGISEERA